MISTADIYRHEEEVAAYLSQNFHAAPDAEKALPTVDRLCLALGRAYVMECDRGNPERDDMTEHVDWLVRAILRERDVAQAKRT